MGGLSTGPRARTSNAVSEGDILQVFDHTGAEKRTIDISRLGMYSPNGLNVGNDGGLYVADTGQNRVLKLPPNFDSNSPPQIFDGMIGKSGVPTPNNKLKETLDVAVRDVGGEDMIYVVDSSNRIVRFSQDGRMLGQWAVKTGTSDGGSKLAISPDGKSLYMTNPDTHELMVLDTENGQARALKGVGEGSGALAQPSGIAVGPDGRVYVVDNAQSNIKIYTIRK